MMLRYTPSGFTKDLLHIVKTPWYGLICLAYFTESVLIVAPMSIQKIILSFFKNIMHLASLLFLPVDTAIFSSEAVSM